MIIKSRFSKQEDDQIKALVLLFGHHWAIIADQMKGRNSKQIRERYVNYLDEKNLNKSWSKEDDSLLLKLFNQFGSKWNDFKNYFPGETGVHLKNRFHVLNGKKKYHLIIDYCFHFSIIGLDQLLKDNQF
jgi:hypothetical protein